MAHRVHRQRSQDFRSDCRRLVDRPGLRKELLLEHLKPSQKLAKNNSSNLVAGRIVKKAVISVVIPTYNNAALLPETLDGVKRQTIKDLEIIVVDDGPTDRTAEVVKTYDTS